jgi:DivIVA domain-containing protein
MEKTAMSDGPTFRTVMRGYDVAEVDKAVADLEKTADQAKDQVAHAQQQAEDARAEAAQLRHELNTQRAQLNALQDEREANGGYSSLTDLGERINRIFGTVDNETKQILATAKAEARRITEESTAAAEQLRRQADDYAKETKSRIDTDSVRIIADAQAKANDILDHADRESTARRDEAEAIFEQQRARAAAMAAEFEQTLADRREKAANEFAAQLQAQEDAIAAAEDRRATIESEAERYKTDVQGQAEAALTAANNQAYEIVEQARLSAERVRRESERELQAAGARRDAITAQLTNIRQMLATVGGSALVDSLDSGIDASPANPELGTGEDYDEDNTGEYEDLLDPVFPGDNDDHIQQLIDDAKNLNADNR